VTTITVLAIAATTAFTPLVGHSTQWLYALLASLGLVGASSTLLWYLRPSLLARAYAAGAVFLTGALFVYGASNSVVVHGTVYWNGSATARVYHLATQLNDAVLTIRSYDALLSDTVSVARANFGQFAIAEKDVGGLLTYWGTYPTTGLPDTRFVDAINYVVAAANADAGSGNGAAALPDQAQYVQNSYVDTTLAQAVATYQATVHTALADATAVLDTIAASYHFSLPTKVSS
jgi:hypothetical protein